MKNILSLIKNVSRAQIVATCLFLVFAVSAASQGTVGAISTKQQFLIQQDIKYYDYDVGCNLGTSSDTNQPIISGDSVDFPLDDGTNPKIDNVITSGTATQISAQAKRGAQFAVFVGHKNSIGGIRPDEARFYEEHPSGNALDFHSSNMGTAVPPGTEFDFFNSLAETFAKNHEALSVHEVIWNNKIISGKDGFTSWRPYTGYGSTTNPTLQHKDHVHVRFDRVKGSTQIKLYGTLKPGAGSGSQQGGPATPVDEGALSDATDPAGSSAPGNCSCPGASDGGASGPLVGSDNIQKAFNYFVSLGYTPEQSAGILGNLYEESHLDPKIVQGGGHSDTVPVGSAKGYGIAQWTDTGRQQNLVAFAGKKNLPVSSLELQLQFITEEMKGYNSLESDLKGIGGPSNKAIESAAFLFHKEYERSADSISQIGERATSGQKIFGLYGGSVDASASVGAAIVGSNCANGVAGAGSSNFVDNFKVYSQYDPKWANKPYSTSTIKSSGCGPSAMAMIITALTGEQVTPVETANYAASQGMYVPGAGSKWTIGPVLAAHWNLKSKAIGANEAAINAALKSGALIITSGQGPKPFTSGGHFIVVRAVTADGKYLVGDSGHNDTSDKQWDPAQLIASMNDGSVYAIYK